MTDKTSAPLETPQDRLAGVAEFAVTNPAYYRARFHEIGSRSSYVFSFNLWAFLLGPIWFGGRSIWNWGLAFLILETFGWVQIIRGAFGDLAVNARIRIEQIEGTLAFRQKQLQAALEKGSEKAEVYRRTVDSLEANIGEIRMDAVRAEEAGFGIMVGGLVALFVIKFIQASVANTVLEKRYSTWLSNPTLERGMRPRDMVLAVGFNLLIICATVMHYSFPDIAALFAEFPTRQAIRMSTIGWVEWLFTGAVANGEVLFDAITYAIRLVLDFLEIAFVQTPWFVIISFIVLLTGLSAGLRTAIFSTSFLAYIGLLGFWEKAMTTLALLGTAACLSITIGIPLGMYCARRDRFYSFIRPIMDFMQTMPAFVFMIPVIAFFGTGKPAAVVTTMIFGGTPVVRLTVLGLRGVPENVREAAISYGASKWYLLTKVDLPLAAPSIRAGVNQTIMLSLAMVVVASLIGAKGLGEDVLEALQYANVGQGILAGFAILFCAMMLDRIVQGRNR
jgi:glycine betaine/proline transport system permease protein